jgi:phage N-6-adenine-methyltransferase
MIWSTPQPIFDALDREFHFSIDLCADADNAKCPVWLPREKSLSVEWKDWQGWAWLNPPYGKEISAWTKKAADSGWPIVSFLPGRTNAPWWHDDVMRALQLRFVRRKVSFANGNGCKGVPPWGAAVAIFATHQEAPLVCTSWDWRKD